MEKPFLRFVTNTTHPPFGHRTGVFKVAYELERTSPPNAPMREELAARLRWFEAHLATPARLTRSRHPRAQETALSWIKSAATEHVRELRALAALVEESGQVPIQEVSTHRPGYVVFEDQHQVVAVPFADTPS